MSDFRDFIDAIVKYGHRKNARENVLDDGHYAPILDEEMKEAAKAAEAALMKIIAKSEAGK